MSTAGFLCDSLLIAHLRGTLQGHLVGTSPLVCNALALVAGTVHKSVHTK